MVQSFNMQLVKSLFTFSIEFHNDFWNFYSQRITCPVENAEKTMH